MVDVEADRFSVALIPHTLAATTLGQLAVGGRVNLETDLLAKYAQKQLDSDVLTDPTSYSTSADSATRRVCISADASRARSKFSCPLPQPPIRRSRTSRGDSAEVGMRLNTRHGQNFLIDLNLLRLIVERAELAPGDVVLEVGTGTGALTALMAPRVAAVVTVEIDPQLHQLASEELFALSNVVMLEQDALANKSHFDPRRDRGRRRTSWPPARPPAQAGRQLALQRGHAGDRQFAVVADRAALDDRHDSKGSWPIGSTARPGTKDYGALSVWIQSQCRVELVRILPPSVFWPRPKVTSAIMHIDGRRAIAARDPRSGVLPRFRPLAVLPSPQVPARRAAQRLEDRLEKPRIDEVLAESGISPDCRAEQLDVPTILALGEAVRQACGSVARQGLIGHASVVHNASTRYAMMSQISKSLPLVENSP